jgi:hypothetical protein
MNRTLNLWVSPPRVGKAAVAVANKVARIVWAVWSRGETYGRDQRAA